LANLAFQDLSAVAFFTDYILFLLFLNSANHQSPVCSDCLSIYIWKSCPKSVLKKIGEESLQVQSIFGQLVFLKSPAFSKVRCALV